MAAAEHSNWRLIVSNCFPPRCLGNKRERKRQREIEKPERSKRRCCCDVWSVSSTAERLCLFAAIQFGKWVTQQTTLDTRATRYQSRKGVQGMKSNLDPQALPVVSFKGGSSKLVFFPLQTFEAKFYEIYRSQMCTHMRANKPHDVKNNTVI